METQNIFEHFGDHLPEKDFVLIILKGHLLIEELLDTLITKTLKKPTALKDARLSFIQKSCLAHSILGDIKNIDHFWSAIKKLNTLRNEIAHNLESRKIEKYMFEFIELAGVQTQKKVAELNTDSREKSLRDSILIIFVTIKGFVDGINSHELIE